MPLSMSTPGLGPSLPPTTELLASLANIAQRTDSAMTNAGLLSVLLQGSKLPEIYVQPEQDRPTKSHDVQSELEVELPVVDLSAFNSADGPLRDAALAKIVRACETWGFVQVINHGVDIELIEKCEAEVHRLFQLPVCIKENALRVPGALYGYGANFWLNLPAMNWAESFHINKHNCKEYAAKLWPSDYERFSSSVEKYITQVEDLGHRVRRVLTEGLGLEAGHFDNYFTEEETVSTLRMNFYPLCPEPSKALGLKAHRDPHFLTLLHQDSTGGLQIWNESRDEWFNVKPRTDSFIVNVGDVLQAASNGRYRSVLHRAVVNSYKTRLSMACFFNTSATVVAPSELITPENPQRYRPFSWKEYIRTAYTFTTGKVSQLDELYAIQSSSAGATEQ
ncbi:protein MpDOX9 [Marchantia polymorpha subsp. ruderalis]|uniref:Fe2OG dioxygenase domain-containing protein n=2 Tax=Marchantia polymorpha TaxID=3197 RepID=A0A176VEK7_MARPO|nr:hypothetical protein AXG93_1860s1390 [Marchantia polymorpha subsp. ruderalis]PTQ35269.1 hypothetical protein MARPO_0072s0026 [Marchantia polymorpha]BBN03382.1 hypothetical protein Mp_2g23050 [Marchantia polymorpha subsp. ruderalis]|eukprot:PTQ35269.1 hypothetical protein MARPO_0072s0026 [Marchantia polymorpha]